MAGFGSFINSRQRDRREIDAKGEDEANPSTYFHRCLGEHFPVHQEDGAFGEEEDGADYCCTGEYDLQMD